MRLLVVSNRLPITVEKKEGKLELKESSGGLVSGLSAYLDSLKGSSFPAKMDYIWVGWPGIEIEERDKEELNQKVSEYHASNVFLSEKVMDKFYQGFCNKTVWPLFHYFTSFTIYEEEYWESYNQVNKIFCDALVELYKPGDLVWVHDYHLMLLPKMIRDRIPEAKIGFFLHIPFPTFEVYSLLPSKWRAQILEGLLGSDIIGFHTYDYTQYFLRCARRILGYEADLGSIHIGQRRVKADTFPMGIDYSKFWNSVDNNEVQNYITDYRNTLKYEKVIFSVDRLDYTKGILNRLQAYEIFLEKNPQWIGRIILIVQVVPSRIGVEHYRKMKKQIDEFVGHLNGKFGKINWTPVNYQYGFMSFYPLVAMYSIADIILVTPLRDGMNLISKEYLACRKDSTGVLILSEMAGSSKELGEALIINPNNREETADAIAAAIELPEAEQIRRNQIMQARLKRYDVVRWAEDFIQKLNSVTESRKHLESKMLNSKNIEEITFSFKKADKHLIFLDYDGTLVPFAPRPELAEPNNELLKLFQKLTSNSKTDFVLISGRDKNTLNDWFGKFNIDIIAEHGAWVKKCGQDWRTIKPLQNNWKSEIYPILEIYVDRLPGAFIEEKEYSLAWHYRKADPELASLRTRELLDHLVYFTANIDIQALQGNKVIEIRNSGVNKGSAGLNWIDRSSYDFIMAIGDDWTDEDLFKVLPNSAYSIKVGLDKSNAKYYLSTHKEVLDLLEKIGED